MRTPPAFMRPGADNVALGIAAKVAGMACISSMDATAKWLGASYPIVEVIFFRNLFGLLPILLVVYFEGGVRALHTRHPGMHLLRSFFILIAMFLFFTALRALPLAEATAIAFAAPLFITALSVPMLREHVGWRRWAAVIAGFLGVLVIVRPGAAAFQIEAVLPLGTAAAFGMVLLLTRRMSRTETTGAIAFWGTLIPAVVAGLILPFYWVAPAWHDLPTFVLMGLLGGGAAFFLAVAYRNGPAAVIAPFDYTALVWATPLGWLVWGDFPGPWVWLGAAIVIASGLYIIRRETGKGRAEPRPSPAAR